MKSNSSITSMKDFVFSWKSLPDKSSMMNWNMHNLKYCESLTSFHSAIQSQHQNQIGASPKDNKKNYLKLKIFTKKLSMNLEIICAILTTGKIRKFSSQTRTKTRNRGVFTICTINLNFPGSLECDTFKDQNI
ncbi:CLUMA_CG020407, isoform A [Clunio marinus]|uniref:CLUMA_CG020407, isoform A n=1 Tax=Clunio marinus TaxID=568069 RepID=A0A1J1J4V1_9DIPT|nr:CLUMA_CG020407, isoform A [Clunio marinus]